MSSPPTFLASGSAPFERSQLGLTIVRDPLMSQESLEAALRMVPGQINYVCLDSMFPGCTSEETLAEHLRQYRAHCISCFLPPELTVLAIAQREVHEYLAFLCDMGARAVVVPVDDSLIMQNEALGFVESSRSRGLRAFVHDYRLMSEGHPASEVAFKITRWRQSGCSQGGFVIVLKIQSQKSCLYDTRLNQQQQRGL